MDTGVKTSVDIKLNFFAEYMEVPEALMQEFLEFKEDVKALGEQCADSTEFEHRFATEGYQDRMNDLIPGCIPKPVQMTAEQKRASHGLANEMTFGGSDPASVAKGMTKEAVKTAAGMASTELKSEALRMRREQMIEAGTFDDYTRVTNKIEDAKIIGKFLGRKLGKK